MSLSEEQRAEIVERHVLQFEGERYSRELDLARLVAIPDEKRDSNWKLAVREILYAIDTIDEAIEVTRQATPVDLDALRTEVE